MPVAPGLFSMTTDWPRNSDSFCAIARPVMSVPPLVPQAHDVAVGVDELGAVSPEILLRRMGEGNAARRPFAEGPVDVVNLEPERDAVRHHVRPLLQEDRKARAVLQRHRVTGGDLELDLQAERCNVPLA